MRQTARITAALAATMLGLTTSPAAADELSRTDKLRALYSNQFSFDRRGVPLVTVRIAEGLGETVVESGAPIRVLPDGEGGSEVRGGRRWKVTLRRSRAARIEHHVVLATEPLTQLARLRRTMAGWKQRGARCKVIELGTIFGVKGTVFDNRSYVLVDGPYPSRKRALQVAERYHAEHDLAKVAVIPQLARRPSGLFEARDLETGATVTVKDALWFDATGTSTLDVRRGGETGRYRGQIYVTVDRRGKLAVVNSVPADRLLAGLVPAEIFSSAPRAALRAQAVAARGELLVKIGTRHLVDPYLLCSTQHCQVYRGAGSEHPRTTAAVGATRGMVLMGSAGNLVDTVYSASAGGFTEHNDAAWPVKPDRHLRGHLDAPAGEPGLDRFRGGITEDNIVEWLDSRPRTWSSRSRFNQSKYRWTTTIPARRMRAHTRDLKLGRVRAIEVLARGVSGRATLIKIVGSRGSATVRGELTIRRRFGGLRSSMFIVKPVTDAGGAIRAWRFRGGGWGHGVGMCQTGAIGMAAAGRSYKQILDHYYTDSQLRQLY